MSRYLHFHSMYNSTPEFIRKLKEEIGALLQDDFYYNKNVFLLFTEMKIKVSIRNTIEHV